MREVMGEIMRGEVAAEEMGAIVRGVGIKVERVWEITAGGAVMGEFGGKVGVEN